VPPENRWRSRDLGLTGLHRALPALAVQGERLEARKLKGYLVGLAPSCPQRSLHPVKGVNLHGPALHLPADIGRSNLQPQ